MDILLANFSFFVNNIKIFKKRDGHTRELFLCFEFEIQFFSNYFASPTNFTYLRSFNRALYANKDGYCVKQISITFQKK